MAAAEAWINLLLKRGPELRRAGILSIGCDGNSAVLAPADPGDGEVEKDKPPGDGEVEKDKPPGDGEVEKDKPAPEAEESSNPWENPASYPTGSVPRLDVDQGAMPEIPTFGDD